VYYPDPEGAAQICRNGHLINADCELDPSSNRKFCPVCGSATVVACPGCRVKITSATSPWNSFIIPAYCHNCGKPFPWTEIALSAAKEYTDDLELTAEEKTALKGALDDLTSDTARTPVAANRLRKVISKVGPIAGGVLQKLAETIATEAAKKAMGL
jgi:hypothetical protein